MMKSKLGIDEIILFLSGIILFLGSVFYLKNIPAPISAYIPFLATMDYFITLIVIFFLLRSLKKNTIKKYISTKYVLCFEKRYQFLYPIVFFLFYKAYKSLSLLLSGIYRHDLITNYNPGVLVKLFAPVVLFSFVFSIVFKVRKRVFLLSFLGVLSLMVTNASRAELMFVSFLILTMFFFKEGTKKEKRRFVIKLGGLFFSFLVIAASITIFLQKRSSSSEGVAVLEKVFDTIFRYRAFSFYLADKAILASSSIEKVLYPFGGYISEKFVSFIQMPSIPIDTKFVLKFYFLGCDESGNVMVANVLYPWWSWFYGAFGVFGLLIKALYIVFLFNIMAKFKLYLSFVYFLCVNLYLAPIRHPLLSIENVLVLFVVILIDLFVINTTNDTDRLIKSNL